MRPVLFLAALVACSGATPKDSGTSPSSGTTTGGSNATGTPTSTGTPTGTVVPPQFFLISARMAHADDGRRVVAGSYGGVMYWDDAAWHFGGHDDPDIDSIEDAVFDGTRFVAVGGTSDTEGPPRDYHVYESDDGVWWTRTPGVSYERRPTKLLFGNGVYLILRSDNQLMRSTDRVAWTETSGASQLSGDFGEGVFVVSDGPGTVRVSTDGQTWTEHATGVPAALHLIRHTANGFAGFAFDDFGNYDPADDVWYFATSPDGLTWTSVTPNAGGNWDIVWHDGQWVSTPGIGLLYTSPDGVTWAQDTTSLDTGLYDLHIVDGTLYAIGHRIYRLEDDTWVQEPFAP